MSSRLSWLRQRSWITWT